MKVLLVCGAWGSGTSAVAGLLSRLGAVGFGPYYTIGDPETPCSYELIPFQDALLPFLSEETLSLGANMLPDVEANLHRLRVRIQHQELGPYDGIQPIFFKYPLSALVIPQICNVFPDAKLIYVLRPLKAIEKARRRRGWEVQTGRQGAEVIYSHMFRFLIERTYPTMLVRYSELLQSPATLAQRLSIFAELNATPAQVQEAASCIRQSSTAQSDSGRRSIKNTLSALSERVSNVWASRKYADSSEQSYWNNIFVKCDPWNYANSYEQTKYRHTLELLPTPQATNAIELGCAEGIFTEMLAPHVDHLLAIDLSDVALKRAQVRCRGKSNVKFAQHDISSGMIGADYDLVVCSEILYYLRDRTAIEKFVGQIWSALIPGGYLLMTHANVVSDDRSTTGFDFNEIGAKDIATIVASCTELEFLRELRTELYRVQLFRRAATALGRDALRPKTFPREVLLREAADFEQPSIKWGGCVVTAAEARHCWVTREVPILLYHRVATDGPPELAPYRLAPENFERQLAWLQRYGFHSLSLDDFFEIWFTRNIREFPGKPIVLTFDDAYADFYHSAWPLLRRYGFSATVFVPTDYVGGNATWDVSYGPPAQIMSWNQINELHRLGIQFGSHGCSHKVLTELSKRSALEDAINSRRILKDNVGIQVSGYSYPHAAADQNSRRIIEQAGYKFAVGINSSDGNDPFYIPRIEIFGSDTIEDFIARLPEPHPVEEAARLKYQELSSRRDRATYLDR